MLQLAWLLIFVAISGLNAELAQNNGDVDITKHPYVVSIRKNDRHICSGAIIDDYHVITSDRCVPPMKHVWNIMNNIVVYSGTHSIKSGGVRIFSKEMFSQNHFINPVKNPVTSSLGVIKIQLPFKFSAKVQPISLSEAEVPLGSKLQMVGWMMIDPQGKKTANLKEATLEIIDKESCQSFYAKTLSDSEFCTQPVPENDFCKGDSGSPLIYEDKLVGLATYGISCENSPVPDVHTSVNKNREYLEEIINPKKE